MTFFSAWVRFAAATFGLLLLVPSVYAQTVAIEISPWEAGNVTYYACSDCPVDTCTNQTDFACSDIDSFFFGDEYLLAPDRPLTGTFTANPANGWVFDGWMGFNCESVGENSCAVQKNSSGTLIANFSAIEIAALIPNFDVPIATADGFTVAVNNYDADYTWAASTNAGSASIDSNGLITVTGLNPGQSATVTVTTNRTGYASGTADVSGNASTGSELTPTFAAPTSTADGFTVAVNNYDADYTWAASTNAGSASIDSNGLITVTGLNPGQSATVTVTTNRTGYASGTADVSGNAIGDSDSDGVNNIADICPETPNNEIANNDGCSSSQLDTDGDGVPDNKDECPLSARNSSVDSQGCAGAIVGGPTTTYLKSEYLIDLSGAEAGQCGGLELLSVAGWQWAISNSVSLETAAGGDSATKVNLGDLSLTFVPDGYILVEALTALVKGSIIPEGSLVELVECKTPVDLSGKPGKPVVLRRVFLNRVLVTSLRLGASGGEFTARMTLNSPRITVCPFGQCGVTYDATTNTVTP